MGRNVIQISLRTPVAAGPQVVSLKVIRSGTKQIPTIFCNSADGLTGLQTWTAPAITLNGVVIYSLGLTNGFRSAQIANVREDAVEQGVLFRIQSHAVPSEHDWSCGCREVVFVSRPLVESECPVIFVCCTEVRLPVGHLRECHWANRDVRQITPKHFE
jgi:hypothetical protein